MYRFRELAAVLAFFALTAGAALTQQAWAAGEIFAAGRPEIERQLQAAPALPGAGLFDPLPATAPNETPASAGPAILRQRNVALNPSYLQALLGARMFTVDAAGAVAQTPDRATLNLFDDLKVEIVPISLARSTLGPQVLRAAVIGGGTATLVIAGDGITAQITAGDHTVTIQPAADGAARITEYAQSSGVTPNDAERPPLAPGDELPHATPGSRFEKPGAGATTQLRILVVYTPQALNYVSSIRSTITLLVDDLNATLANSQVPVQFTLAAIDQVNYAEAAGGTSTQVLNDIQSGVGDFARIMTLRAAVNADLVSVISSFNESAGAGSFVCARGSLNDFLDTVNSVRPYARFGFSTVTAHTNCAGSMSSSFSHEVGHNLGADHDRYVLTNPAPGPTLYGVGYVDVTGKFRDTMAYADKCTAAGVSCPRVPYYSNPNLTYTGRPLGVADNLPEAADASRKIGEIAPYVAQFHTFLTAPATPVLAMVVSGSGTITSAPAGINCGDTCSASFAAGTAVTLAAAAPAGWSLGQWSGDCTGIAACTVTMSASRNVTATFIPTLRFGPVFSSAQANSQSFIRLVNSGSSAGTASVRLWDYTNGTLLGQWTSPQIPAGSALQYGISTIESAITGGTKPQYYAVAVQSQMNGGAQHVLWKPSDGTLTNLSTCDTGITASATQVANVHTSILDNGYPSSVAVNNTGASDVSGIALGVYDARNGAKLGTYALATIPSNSKLILTVDAIEAGASVKPTSDMYHYVLKVEGTLTGFLQHLVNNQAVSVITDMTTNCTFGTVPALLQTIAMRQPGPLYSTAQSASQSFLRFANTGTTSGTVAVTLRNSTTGAKLGQWISPSILPGAAPQYPIADIESGMNIGTKPQYYSAWIESQITGSVAHVLWKPGNGTLTNLSTCDAGISANTAEVDNVHTSLVGADYASTVAVSNSGSAAQAFTLGVYDARDGRRLGGYATGSIPANGQLLLSVPAIEASLNITPTAGMYHYVIKLEGAGTGFLQHLVNNKVVGVITDMTTVCKLPAKVVSYTDCSPGATPRCSTTLGANTAGQLKQASSWANHTVPFISGVTYTINVKGASTNNGTLARPYIFIYGPNGGASLASGGGGGTGNDAKLTFTPTSSGGYVIQVTTYIFADNAGTFVLNVN